MTARRRPSSITCRSCTTRSSRCHWGPTAIRSGNWLRKAPARSLRLQATPNGEYEDKFAVIMASGDIPDVMSFNPAQARSSDMIESLFADLGPHLSGDAALDYPHLANIPTPSWRAGVRGEKVFGIPQPRALTGEMTYIREDLFEAAGLNPEPTNGEEFLQLLRDIKAAGNNQWGWSNVGRFNTTLLQMMNCPRAGASTTTAPSPVSTRCRSIGRHWRSRDRHLSTASSIRTRPVRRTRSSAITSMRARPGCSATARRAGISSNAPSVTAARSGLSPYRRGMATATRVSMPARATNSSRPFPTGLLRIGCR
ncbi:hypothetical protein CGZ91_06440 [Parenemella sanctibonifatiensis]|uniref:Extracellular solute-binding protein n=1 Tax=Parenemella sanctibonifatiensis TaxID=2016505 RepID=A0A255ESJ5_9ACTN|nr:hypothetical protein CGZ91_06440 [Parenemella sanctibonifatiensis]